MHKNPYIEDKSQASEQLRLTLNLLSRHEIPLSPFNYRIGYDCISGNNKELKISFDELVSNNDTPTSDSMWELYNNYYMHDDETLEVIREELKTIVINIQGNFDRSGTELSSYSNKLERFTSILNTPTSPEAMAVEVKKVIKETLETEQSQRRFEAQLSHVATEMEALRKELLQVREESLTDALTNIANRKAFDNALKHETEYAQETNAPLSLLLLDIDHFKKVNDTFGHLIGDKVLRFVATNLKRSIKGRDLAARYGGEEFAIILPETHIQGACSIAEQIRITISAGTLKDTKSQESYGSVTLSIGVAQFNKDDMPNDLLQRADEALCRAKEHGHNRIEKTA